jgi:S-adenosylmethionine-diacylglycerol 3-amino-3-carboxypropyl transferase
MMKDELLKDVPFDLIRYANCWEDAEVLLHGLDPAPGSRLLSIGSAGDNSFSLLVTDPVVVVAIDINKVQLYLIKLKKCAITQLAYEDTLSFLGFSGSNDRSATFNTLKSQLDDETRRYWESNIHLIEAGIIHQGKFERYFQSFSRHILPFIHSTQTVNNLLRKKSGPEQKLLYAHSWNTWRWRILFKVFFSKYILGKFGRDPEFLKEVKIPVSHYIFDKAAAHLQSQQCQSNYMLHYNLKGSFGGHLPHYLQRQNYEIIQKNIDRLVIMEGYAETATLHYGQFSHMNLSNIFEYMDNQTFIATAMKLVQSLEPGGKMAYWNLMVPRYVSKALPEKVIHLKEWADKASTQDKGFFYNQFIIDQKIG